MIGLPSYCITKMANKGTVGKSVLYFISRGWEKFR